MVTQPVEDQTELFAGGAAGLRATGWSTWLHEHRQRPVLLAGLRQVRRQVPTRIQRDTAWGEAEHAIWEGEGSDWHIEGGNHVCRDCIPLEPEEDA